MRPAGGSHGSVMPEHDSHADEKFMSEALELARQGMGMTDPNPMVGALIVKEGNVVGRGYHERYGAPHAEAKALEDAGGLARGQPFM